MNFFSLFKRNILYRIKKKINIDTQIFKGKSLDYLFNFYGSDKSIYFKNTKKFSHGYSKYYEKYLKHYKNKKINILEIGSFSGASAAALSKYFIKSQIFCFDINISNFLYKSKKIEVFGIDIAEEKKVIEILKKITRNRNLFFDIIIDDGSHKLSDILKSFNLLSNYLKKGGFYIIEDYKFPNYFSYNKDINDILVSEMINNLVIKKKFSSNIITKDSQKKLFKSFNHIKIHKGKLDYSDICFLKRK